MEKRSAPGSLVACPNSHVDWVIGLLPSNNLYFYVQGVWIKRGLADMHAKSKIGFLSPARWLCSVFKRLNLNQCISLVAQLLMVLYDFPKIAYHDMISYYHDISYLFVYQLIMYIDILIHNNKIINV